MNPIQHFMDHWDDVLTGATMLGLAAHAVSTFPTPQNKYGQWFLGCVQFIVGQRVAAQNTFKGQQTIATGVQNFAKSSMTEHGPDQPKL